MNIFYISAGKYIVDNLILLRYAAHILQDIDLCTITLDIFIGLTNLSISVIIIIISSSIIIIIIITIINTLEFKVT